MATVKILQPPAPVVIIRAEGGQAVRVAAAPSAVVKVSVPGTQGARGLPGQTTEWSTTNW